MRVRTLSEDPDSNETRMTGSFPQLDLQKTAGKMKLMAVDPVAPTNPSTTSKDETNMAMVNVMQRMKADSTMKRPSGMSGVA